jgi:hypothetical protein
VSTKSERNEFFDVESPEKILRGWAKAYRDAPEHRFPSDPDAEFFPLDLEYAADEIQKLRAELRLAQDIIRDLQEGK